MHDIIAVVKNDKEYSYQVQLPMIRSYCLTYQTDNSLGVKVDTNPFSIESETW